MTLTRDKKILDILNMLKDYLKKHKIKEFLQINPDLGKFCDDSEKLVLKFDLSLTAELWILKHL